nr:hypothetical protein [Tanacetum cinerariifolium]
QLGSGAVFKHELAGGIAHENQIGHRIQNLTDKGLLFGQLPLDEHAVGSLGQVHRDAAGRGQRAGTGATASKAGVVAVGAGRAAARARRTGAGRPACAVGRVPVAAAVPAASSWQAAKKWPPGYGRGCLLKTCPSFCCPPSRCCPAGSGGIRPRPGHRWHPETWALLPGAAAPGSGATCGPPALYRPSPSP